MKNNKNISAQRNGNGSLSLKALSRNILYIGLAALLVELGYDVIVGPRLDIGPAVEDMIEIFLLVGVLLPLAYLFIYLPQRKRIRRLDEDMQALQTIYRNTLDGIIVADVNTSRFLEINDSVCQMLGYTRKEFLSLGIADIHPKEALPEVQQIFSQMCQGKVDIATEVEFIRKDGASIFLDIRGKAVQYAGRPCVIGFFRDVTRRREVDDQLRIKEGAIEESINGIILAGLDARITYANEALIRMWGFAGMEEVLGHECLDLWASHEEASHIFEHAQKEGKWRGERKGRKKDGTIFDVLVSVSLVHDRDGNPSHLMGSFIDITDSIRMKSELVKSEERYHALFNTVPQGIQLSDAEGVITYSNPTHHRILGYQDGELVGRHIWDFVTDESEGKALEEYYATLIKDAPLPGTVHIKNRTKNGQEVDIQVNWDYIRDPAGNVVEICSVISDITEKRRMEEELKHRERLYRAILESTSAIPFEVELETERFTYIGPQVEKLTGYPVEYWKDFDAWAARILSDDRDQAVKFCRDATKLGDNHDFEYRMETMDGDIVWIRDIVTVVKRNGVPVALRGFLFDITKLKETEDRLRRSEFSLAEAQRIASIGSWDWNIANDTLVWSDEIYRIFGREPQEFGASYEAFLGYVYPDDRDRVINAVDMAVNEKQPYYLEHRIVLPSGEIRHVLENGEVTCDDSGKAVRMLGTVQDVTELRKTERSLMESQQMIRLILDAIPVRVFWKGRNFKYIGCNRLFAWDAGFESPAELIGKDDYSMSWASDAGEYRKDDAEVIESGRPKLNYIERQMDHEGRVSWLRTSKVPLLDADGDVIGVLGTYEDITENIKADKALRESQEGLATAQRIARMGSWHWDVEENDQHWSDEIYRIFGLDPQSIRASYADFIRYVHPDDRSAVMEAVSRALEQNHPYSIEHRILAESGESRIVHEEGEVTFDDKGEPVRMVGTVQDITERRQAEAQMQKLSMALEESINIIYITDREGHIEYVNPKFEEVTGYRSEEVLGKTPSMLGESMEKEEGSRIWENILQGKPWRGVLSNRKKSGEQFWTNTFISPLKNEKGELTNFLVFQEDITETVTAQERLRYLSEYDGITGLLNRNHFMGLLEDVLDTVKSGAMILIDIDGFKFVNEKYGNSVGDDILRRIGKLINGILQESDFKENSILGRPGEDEFALFVAGIQRSEVQDLGEKIRSGVEGKEFTHLKIHITVSEGLVLFPDHASSREDLLLKSDAALLRAKQFGHNKVHLYSPKDQVLEHMHQRIEHKERIIQGLNKDRFEPWFQPILNLKTGKLHYEVLARLYHEDSVLLPGEFMNTAESFGLIGSIDRQVIRKAILHQADSIRQGKPKVFSMNLSGKDIDDETMMEYIKENIQSAGADPQSLIFEITETAAINDMERALLFIRGLRELGCRFSLDDFGVGFTSFVYLTELNVDFIKIDGSFIRRLHEHPRDQLVVKAIIEVAKGLGIKTVAEFVETRETLDLLRAYGVDYAQGYHIGKPAPAPAAQVLD